VPTLHAGTNPDAAQKVLDQALNDVQPRASVDEPPTPYPPSDTQIELPFGYLDPLGGVHRVAEVRELNGNDEEALARIPGDNIGRYLSTMLERGVVRIGEHKTTPEILDELPMADRDVLLIGIRRATYGEHIELVLKCLGCRETIQASVSVDDIPMKVPEDHTVRSFTVQLRSGEAELSLPTGKVHREITVPDKNSAELNTILIASCMYRLNGISLSGPSQARGLSMRDRKTVLLEIIEHMYGPQLGDVAPVECPTCGEEIPVRLTMGDLFRL
jgi:hypothetical protein